MIFQKKHNSNKIIDDNWILEFNEAQSEPPFSNQIQKPKQQIQLENSKAREIPERCWKIVTQYKIRQYSLTEIKQMLHYI